MHDQRSTLTLTPCILCATVLGKRLGSWQLHHIGGQSFRRYGRPFVYAIGAV